MRHRSKLNVKKVGLFLACLGIVGLTGCVLDEVKELGEACPNLEYIENGSDKFTCNNSGCFYYESNEIIYGIETDEYKAYSNAFTSGNCPADFSICYNSDGSRYEHDSNTEVSWDERYCGVAKDKQKCEDNEYYSSKDTICKPSSVNFCGSETNDCTRILGWKDGACTDNKCVVSECSTGFALKDNVCVSSCGSNEYYSSTTNQCEPSTVNFCGSETNDCTTILGWSDGSCENNKCVVFECATGFSLRDNVCVSSCEANEYYSATTNQCEPNTVNFCGSETNDCTRILGWKDGACTDNKCIISECSTGFALKDNVCVSSCGSNEYYSSTTNQCESSTVNFCGSETLDCTQLLGWADGTCENNKCIISACTTGFALKDNVCVSSCGSNEYYSSTTNQCESSTVNFCGSETLDCTKIAGWNGGDCLENVCTASDCEKGYNLENGICKAITSCGTNQYYYNGSCQTSTANKCGSETNDCTKAAGWAGGSCTSNVCKATACETGYNLVNGACKAVTSCGTNEYYYNGSCQKSTANKCGSETNDCTKAAGWAGGSCTSNVCKATACETGYNLVNGACKAITSCGVNEYYYNGSCQTSTVNKCGSETNDCTKAAGWAGGSCTSNVCKATKCETGYNLVNGACKAITSCGTNQYYYNGSCQTSTANKCGSETNDCTKAAGWAGGSCASNICKATKCETGYNLVNGACKAITSCGANEYYYNGRCQMSTVNKCGSETNDCTKAAGWAGGSCASNVCKATACETGYNLVNGACKAITSCGTNEYYYNGSCRTSTANKCGSETNDCTKAAGWAGGSCASNVCKATACETGYNLVNGACKAITSCGTNEYYYNGSCQKSTANKCGSETNDCTKAAGWAGGSCTSNVCKATACETGYNLVNGACKAVTSCGTNEYYYNGSCQTSTANKCGSETNDCTKAAGWAGGSCASNVCKATACETGYNLVNGACKAITSCSTNEYYYNGSCQTSSVYKCGSETNDCTKAAGWAGGKCTNNACVAEACETGYKVEDGVCKIDTDCPTTTPYACFDTCLNEYQLNNWYHAGTDCICLNGYVNRNGDNTDGCETQCPENSEPDIDKTQCVCKTGYTGTNCDECVDNYRKDDDGTCKPINEPTSCGTYFVDCRENGDAGAVCLESGSSAGTYKCKCSNRSNSQKCDSGKICSADGKSCVNP